MTIHAPPEQIYAALGKIGQWWSSSHTFSRDASNLSLDLKAGGCLCERLKDGGSVQHLIVVYAAPAEGLRLRGALGPLQMEGVDGTLIDHIAAALSCCGASITSAPRYRVGAAIEESEQRLRNKPAARGIDMAITVRALAMREKALRYPQYPPEAVAGSRLSRP